MEMSNKSMAVVGGATILGAIAGYFIAKSYGTNKILMTAGFALIAGGGALIIVDNTKPSKPKDVKPPVKSGDTTTTPSEEKSEFSNNIKGLHYPKNENFSNLYYPKNSLVPQELHYPKNAPQRLHYPKADRYSNLYYPRSAKQEYSNLYYPKNKYSNFKTGSAKSEKCWCAGPHGMVQCPCAGNHGAI